MPFVDEEGNMGRAAPAQIVKLLPKLKVGVIFGLTVTVSVVVVAHDPAAGVNVYVPEFWLSTTEGLHVPVIPFAEDTGNEGTVPPLQIVKLVPKLNKGVTFGITVIVIVKVIPH